ncbi:MAG: hypothetical protein FWC97_12760, partial [Treponema sp.]|nr:hypothetical protein [Treponema sp.]
MQNYVKAMIIQSAIVFVGTILGVGYGFFFYFYLSPYLSPYLSLFFLMLGFMWIVSIPLGIYFIFGKHVFFWHGNTSKEE